MSDQMTDERLERTLRDVLALEASDLSGAPRADEMAVRIALGMRPARRFGVAPRTLAWVALAGLLAAAMLGALLVAGSQRRPAPAFAGYEAVFMRSNQLPDGWEVVVIAVGAEGADREIARFPGLLRPPTGAVTPSGLLAIPSRLGDDESYLTWTILDLHRPEMAPVVIPESRQFIEQLREPYHHLEMRPSVFYGPGERIAMAWFRHTPEGCTSCGLDWFVSVMDNRGGPVWTADVPEGMRVLPYWPAIGSGVVVGDDLWGEVAHPRLLRRDGTIGDLPAGDIQSACRTRTGVGPERGYTCPAPDASMTVDGLVEPLENAATLVKPDGESLEVDGTFLGWISVNP